MAVKIRLARYGAKHRPFYRIVVADEKSPRDGKFIEVVGTYDPTKDPIEFTLKRDRIMEWIQKGAIPTEIVKTLLKKDEVAKRKQLQQQVDSNQ